MSFKTCTTCEYVWADRNSFLSDPTVTAIGYQVDFERLEDGLFLFNHDTPECGTTLAMEASVFLDMHKGPIARGRLTPEHDSECSGACLRRHDTSGCKAACEYAYVREVLQVIKDWKKHTR